MMMMSAAASPAAAAAVALLLLLLLLLLLPKTLTLEDGKKAAALFSAFLSVRQVLPHLFCTITDLTFRFRHTVLNNQQLKSQLRR